MHHLIIGLKIIYSQSLSLRVLSQTRGRSAVCLFTSPAVDDDDVIYYSHQTYRSSMARLPRYFDKKPPTTCEK